MESKLLTGDKNIIDHTNEQQLALENKRSELAEQRVRRLLPSCNCMFTVSNVSAQRTRNAAAVGDARREHNRNAKHVLIAATRSRSEDEEAEAYVHQAAKNQDGNTRPTRRKFAPATRARRRYNGTDERAEVEVSFSEYSGARGPRSHRFFSEL